MQSIIQSKIMDKTSLHSVECYSDEIAIDSTDVHWLGGFGLFEPDLDHPDSVVLMDGSSSDHLRSPSDSQTLMMDVQENLLAPLRLSGSSSSSTSDETVDLYEHKSKSIFCLFHNLTS